MKTPEKDSETSKQVVKGPSVKVTDGQHVKAPSKSVLGGQLSKTPPKPTEKGKKK